MQALIDSAIELMVSVVLLSWMLVGPLCVVALGCLIVLMMGC